MSATAPRKAKGELLARIKNMGSIEVLPISALHFDQTYQRGLRNKFAERLANNWSTLALGLPLVSRREDGTLYVVNGQHRVAAANLMGLEDMVCLVVSGLSARDEADLRLHGNVQLAENSLERFKAKVAAKYPDALDIVEIAHRFDTQINESPMADSGLNAVATIEYIYALDRGVTLVRVFEIIQDAWSRVGGERTHAAALKGIAWFLGAHASEFNRARLVERMSVTGPAGLEAMSRTTRAAMRGSLWLNYYRALVECYNERLSESASLNWKTRGWSAGVKDSEGKPTGAGKSESWS
jgi:hypothetical protein